MPGPSANRPVDAPPDYLARLQWGVALQFSLIVAAVPAGVVMFLLARSTSLGAPQEFMALELIGLLGGLAYFSSIWMATAPDLRGEEPASHDQLRRWLRGLSAMAAAGTILSLAARHWADLHGDFFAWPMIVLKASVLGLLCLRYAHLAQMVQDAPIIRGARALAVGLPACYLISCVTMMLTPALMDAGVPSVAALIPLLAVVALTMMCQLLVWTAMLLVAFRLARDLRTAREASAARAAA